MPGGKPDGVVSFGGRREATATRARVGELSGAICAVSLMRV